jgi:hypothetical protein
MQAKSIPPLTEEQIKRFWEKVDRNGGPDSCWPWIGYVDNPGYGGFAIKQRYYRASRIAYLVGIGPFPTDLHVLHRCDNTKCCNPNHLFLGTDADNAADCMAKGRNTLGERNGVSKLTDEKVREMRRRYADGGISIRQLAREYGMTYSPVHLMLSGKAWKHVQDNLMPREEGQENE